MQHRDLARLSLLLLVLALAAGCDKPKDDAPTPVQSTESREQWFHGRTLYEVHPRAFSAAGDLAGVRQGLDQLADLGRPNLILAPPYPTSPNTAGGELGNLYATRDHRAVDPALGSMDDLSELVADAHQRGMRVILDLTFSLAGLDHVAMADHPDWFRRDAAGNLTRRLSQWQGVAELNHDSSELREYLTATLFFWVEKTGVDGFRCTLPTLAPDDFWQELILDAHDRHPELAFIAEGSADRYLELGFDAVYAPAWKLAVDECRLEDMAMLGMREDVWHVVETMVARSKPDRGYILFLEDHFHERSAELYILDYLAGYAGMLMTLPGTPQLLMGQEVGSMVSASPEDPWQVDWETGDQAVRAVYRETSRLRDASAALRRGDITWVPTRHHEGMVYTRRLGAELVLCAINLSNGKPVFELPGELAARTWHEWTGEEFDGQGHTLEGEVAVMPGRYRVWQSQD